MLFICCCVVFYVAQFGEGLAMAQQLVGEAEAIDSLLKKKRRAPKELLAQGNFAVSTPLLVAAERCATFTRDTYI